MSDIRYSTELRHDEWIGTAENLIAAGVIERELLPGDNQTAVTYWNGRRVRRGENKPHDETYLCIMRRGKNKLCVQRGISAELRTDRERKLELETLKRNCRFRAEKLVRGGREDFRNAALTFMHFDFEGTVNGYRFDAAITQQIQKHLGAVCELIAREKIILDRTLQAEAIAKIYTSEGLPPPPEIAALCNTEKEPQHKIQLVWVNPA